MSAETFLNGRVTLFCGDSRDVLKAQPDNSIDSVVCDPPYALVSIVKRFGAGGAPVKVPEGGSGAYARASAGFMGKQWDTGETAFAVDFWREVLRVLKPGGHVVALAGTRTYHRLACAIEDAGFEIRDAIVEFLNIDPVGREFVESLSETQLGAFMRLADMIGFEGMLGWVYGSGFPKSHDVAKGLGKQLAGPDLRAEWEGWGTALKPAVEPICLARKPLIGTVASNVLAHGTGAINIDGCRIATNGEQPKGSGDRRGGSIYAQDEWTQTQMANGGNVTPDAGRWPANVIHDGSDDVVAAFPDAPGQQGALTGNEPSPTFSGSHIYGSMARTQASEPRNDSGSAGRFFYTAKADADDRLGSKHPTVKPVDLMQWLCRLVTPPGGTVLDPFAGTGTTGEAAFREGFNAILIEREAEYQADIRRRMALVMSGPEERKRESIKAKLGDLPFEAGSLFAGIEAAS